MLKRISLFVLIIVQLIYGLALIPWYVVAQLTYSSFDPVVAAVETGRQWFLYGVLSLPLAPLLCSILGWISFGRRKYLGAIIWTSLPLLVALPVLFYLYRMMYGGF